MRFFLFLIFPLSLGVRAAPLMVEPGELLLEESFDPDSVDPRWFFRGEFALRDGALVRSEINAGKANQRVFLKGAEFHNCIVQFRFRFAGGTRELRLVTGSGGHYNTIVRLQRDHLQVNTAGDKQAGIVPSPIGECARVFESDQWHKLTVEFFGDEVVVHLDGTSVILGRHPIIDRARSYLAFQFDRPSAAIDEVKLWRAKAQLTEWPARRKLLLAAQGERAPVQRSAQDRYRYVHTNVKSRLTLEDPAYRALVARHAELQSALHEMWPAAFVSHKELGKRILAERQRLRTGDDTFRAMQNAVHMAQRAEETYVMEAFPRLAGLPKHRLLSERALARGELERVHDSGLAELIATTARLQSELERRFPAAFASVDSLVAERNTRRKALSKDPEFQRRNRELAGAWQAVIRYEQAAEPQLVELKAAADAP